jgi:hypothetical protein
VNKRASGRKIYTWKIGIELRREEKKNRKCNRNQRKDDSDGVEVRNNIFFKI